jgi:SOS-response transcriptional repressor LexA
MIGLTQRQQECLDFLRSYHAAKGIMPSMQEMIDNLQLNSKSGAARILNGLEERGHIRRTYKKARAIEIINRDDPQFRSFTDACAAREAAEREHAAKAAA